MHVHDQQVEQLSPAKRALLERWRQAAAQRQPEAPRIPRRERNGNAPLSFAQQRLWFLDQLDPGNPAYNVATAVRLSGQLDVAALESALQSLIARHDVLRTTFRAVGGHAEQMVAPRLDWQLEYQELEESTDNDREQTWQRLAQEEALRPFDLQRGPLLRAKLLRLEVDAHVLLLTLHHIVCDGWSMAVLRQEIAQLYTAIIEGRSATLEPLSIQYGDYAVWQRDHLDERQLERLSQYWSRQMTPPPAPLELPLDFPRPATQTFRGDVCRRRIPSALTARLRRDAAAEGTTLFMMLEAALHILLSRWSGQRDICIGTPIANRNHLQLEGLIGFFANTLALRADLSANPTIRKLLSQVRRTTLDALSHQEMPFERLIDSLQLPRDMSRTPLFQVLFVLQNTPLRHQQISGMGVDQVSFDHAPTSSFDLTLNVDEHPDRLDLSLVYNSDLFARPTVEQLLDGYGSLLEELLVDLDRPVLQLSLAATSEAGSSVAHRDTLSNTSEHHHCLHQLISDQAQRTPSALAVVFDDQSLTYEQLDARSNRLASYLASRGVAADSAVGVCLERSSDLIVCLLAILKAGGAYLPLDPNYPRSRLEFMIRDANPILLVSTTDLASRLPGNHVNTVFVDSEAEAIASASDRPVVSRVVPGHLANIIYTSGSTGEPKGAEIEHRGLVNHAVQLADRLRLGQGDRMLQFLSLSFDAAGEEIWPTLISGATLYLHAAPAELSGKVLLDWSRSVGVNVLHLTPPIGLSLLDEIEAQGAEAGRHLKAVVVGGASVSREDAARWVRVTQGEIPFLLAYGVTEAAITTTLFEADDTAIGSASACLPIGRPLLNTRVYVLDEFQQPVPLGVRGELYLGGIGVGRGYRNRPELTRERFVADPFSTAPGARMYRTGDYGRCLRDGNFEFLGRLDQQVKIRGYRIEMGEIEAALCRHAGVREAIVLASEDETSHKQLMAYVASATEAQPTEAELRSHLGERLPAHMIPAHFVILDALPRLPNGKLDRQALPAVSRRRPVSTTITEPRNEIERLLVSVWASVLDIPQLGVHDNFFELGGDSIRSIQVVARARDAGLQITPKLLFQHQTIAELAPFAGRAVAICAEQGPVTGFLPLTPIQEQFFALGLKDAHHFNQSVLLKVNHRDVRPQIIEAALQQIVAHHDALRLSFTEEASGNWRQCGMSIGARSVVDSVDLSELSGDALAAAIENACGVAQASLDLESAQLLRAVYFDLGPERAARLLLVVHHLAVDAVSWRILLEDLSIACAQREPAAALRLPAKTTSYADWARRLAEFADSPVLYSEAAAWLSTGPVQQLPRDLSGGRNQVASESSIEVSLSADETARWLYECHAAYRTRPHELLIAALVDTLGAYEGEGHVGIELEGHGREELFEDVDLSRTVGWFTTLFPLVTRRPGGDSPGALIKSVKEQIRTVRNGGIGFGLLRWLSRDSQVRQQMATAARGEVSFNYLGQLDNFLPAGAPFSLTSESTGPSRSPRGMRPHVWEVIAYVQHGCLKIDWRFATDLHNRGTIERLVHAYLANLRRLVAHCLEPDAGGATPTDFPLAALDQEDLDRLSALLGDPQTPVGE